MKAIFLLSSLALVLFTSPTWANGASKKNAQIVVNALRYVYELQNRNEELLISVLYDPSQPKSKIDADILVKAFAQQTSLSGYTQKVESVSIQAFLNGRSGKVIYVPGGMESYYAQIYEQSKQRNLFTVSADKDCVTGECCILAVKTDLAVHIYLNEKTLRDMGFSVEAAFKFMAERV